MHLFPIWISSLYRFVYNLNYFFWALFLLNKGFDIAQVGLALAVNSIVGLLASIPVGVANDRFHSRNLLQVGVLFFLSQIAAAAYFDSFPILLLFFGLGGIGNRLIDISIDSYVLKSEQQLENKSILPYFLLLRFWAIAAGMVLGGNLIGRMENGNFALMLIGSGIGIVVLFFCSMFLSENTTLKVQKIEADAIYKLPSVVLLLVGFGLFALHFGAEIIAYSPFLKTELGLNTGQAGWYMGGAVFIMGIAAYTFSKLVNKGLPAAYLLIFGLIQSGIFHILMVNDVVWLSFVFRTLHEIGDAAVFAFMYQGAVRLFPTSVLASYFGLVTFITFMASSISSLIYGKLSAIYGISFPLQASGVLMLFVAALFIAILGFWPKLRKTWFAR